VIALDTNVIVRLLAGDDPPHARRAATLMQDHATFVAKTVLLEAEWVLRHAYELDPKTINQAFRKLLGLPGLATEDAFAVSKALAWHEAGLDFADALHLASSREAQAFATFDKALVRKGKKLARAMPVFAPQDNRPPQCFRKNPTVGRDYMDEPTDGGNIGLGAT
jgi:predicted nucleic-acid-binding protein